MHFSWLRLEISFGINLTLDKTGIPQDFITVHDVGDFLVALTAQGRGNQRERGRALR